MYHERMESFYVFGGISYTREVTNNLFVLHFPTRRWSKVPINNGRNMPYPRALHAAVATESYMVIYGGMANQGKLIYYESHLAYHVMVPHIPTLLLIFTLLQIGNGGKICLPFPYWSFPVDFGSI